MWPQASASPALWQGHACMHDKVELSCLPICAVNIRELEQSINLRIFAPPHMVSTFILFPVLRTASKNFMNNLKH